MIGTSPPQARGRITPEFRQLAVAASRSRARRDAVWLREHPPIRLEVVTTSYDTAYADVSELVIRKLRQLNEVFPRLGSVQWRLRIVHDAPQEAGFGPAVERALFEAAPLGLGGRASLQPVFYGKPGRYGRKGLALREGFLSALHAGADVVAYVNLNPKVDARLLATGLRRLLLSRADAAVATRARDEGGLAAGAGVVGRLKSAVWSELVRAAAPPLDAFADQNAPMKLFRRAAARHIVERARIDGVTLDAEWMLILIESGARIDRFPVVWVQDHGSRPPFLAVLPMISDLARIRRARERGALRAQHAGATEGDL